MENDDIRRFHGLSDPDTGVIVVELYPLAPAKNVLQLGDVVLSIDDIRVSPLKFLFHSIILRSGCE